MKKLLFLICIVALFSGCKKNEPEKVENETVMIVADATSRLLVQRDSLIEVMECANETGDCEQVIKASKEMDRLFDGYTKTIVNVIYGEYACLNDVDIHNVLKKNPKMVMDYILERDSACEELFRYCESVVADEKMID